MPLNRYGGDVAKCCNKELEVPKLKKTKGLGPNLIIVECPDCMQQWAFQPWMCQWSRWGKNTEATMYAVK